MNKLTFCALLTFCLVSAQINVGSEDGGDGGSGAAVEGEEDVNTRIFGEPINSFLITTGAVVTGNVATAALGAGFNAFRDRCRFRRRKRQTQDGNVEVDTRIICPQDLLPADCDRCNCFRDRNCQNCARCRNDGYYPGPIYNQGNNYNNNFNNYRPSNSYRPSSTTTGLSSWSSTSYRPTYVYRGGVRFRIA